jgi:TrmH family RNA methyltransferase
VIEVSAAAFESIAATEHSQGMLAMLRPRCWKESELRGRIRVGEQPLLVVLDGVQDPGNAGAVVRSAEAFAATGVLFGRGSVRVSNPKFLRATAGSIFRIPYLEEGEPAHLAGLPVYSLAAEAELSIREVDFRSGAALVTGSEGAGVSPAFREISTPVRIPTVAVESLNAAVACSIALYEAWQQRREP